ncbi:MAG: restriction endonuclease subunit S [Streptomyces sp.]|uniref:restriction endonuclease subunit S n=1 Tax=Streptomyces sp. TaxID=1931 RepID=UPI0025D2C815|nr:restriction endonuclease subunit S [Streptomyces sp.]MBW8799128.1 restriction endonuclease subunit S [Streptomyces sp.]
MAKWQRIVSDLESDGVLLVQDGNHGEYRPRPTEFGENGTAFIRAADMKGGRVLFESAQKINEIARARVRKGIGAPYDVILSHKGTVGKVAFAPAASPPFVCSPQTTFWRSLNPEVIDPLYLYAFLQSEPFRAQLRARENESDMAAYVSLTEQRRLSVTVPPLEIQRAISGVLGALDGKIAANERLTEVALNLARALYSEASAQDGESTELGDVVSLRYGKALREPDRCPGAVPVYGCTGQVGWHDSALTACAGPVVGRKGANAGWISWAPRPCWVIDTAFFVELHKDYLSPELAFLVLESAQLSALVGDSAVPGLNREAAHRHSVRIPSRLVAPELDNRVRALMTRSTQAQEESRALAMLRDALLPQLMSGKLRVRDAEKIMEDAV